MVPDYYQVLSVAPDAPPDALKKAFQRESLRTHPDRFPHASDAEKCEHTRRFQQVADAYYVLSDPSRRAAYDSARARGSGAAYEPESAAPADEMFADAWSEMLRPEIQRQFPLWTNAGMLSGGVMGYILGNIPGAIGGAVLGRKLGAVRDAKGRAVAEVFLGLSTAQRANVLNELAAKMRDALR